MRTGMLWAVAVLSVVACQANSREASTTAEEAPAAAEKAMAPAPGTPEAKIASAMAAGPESISAQATIIDWTGNPEDKPNVLREGTNGWTCYVDFPSTSDADPICADKTVGEWFEAFMQKQPPKIKTVGLAYMLLGDAGVSETDPWAQAPRPDNQWHKTGPHTMVFVPDPRQLEGMSSDHTTGGPYVMWKSTPFAHIMMPIAPAK